MPQEAKPFKSDEELKSVPYIPAANENGHPYIHSIEPELRQSAPPRPVKRPPLLWSASHTWHVNIGLGFVLGSVYIGRQLHLDDAEIIRLVTCILGVICALAVMLRVENLMMRSSREFNFLRYGIPTVGVFTSGTVNDCEETTYRLSYTFYVDARLEAETVSVTKSDYLRYTTGNPYFTVLYRGKSAVDSVPYFQVSGAGIIV